MSIVDNIKRRVALINVADAFNAVLECLENFDVLHDFTYLAQAAWYFKAGMANLINRNRFTPAQPIYVKFNFHLVETSINRIVTRAYEELMNRSTDCSDEEWEFIFGAINGQHQLWEIEHKMPQNIRRKYGRIV